MKKWLNYHVVIDDRRRCGQEKKSQKPESSSVFVGSFALFEFTPALALPHMGKGTV